MSKTKKIEKTVHQRDILDVEFANEFIFGLDYNINLHPTAKKEITKMREFYDTTL